MLASSIPAKFSIPWANAATGSFIRTIPTASQIGIVPGAASLTDGFPPLNALPVAGGGIPPDVRDENGILNQITAWNRWQQAGAPIGYDATFQTAIGGYPNGAVVVSATTAGLLWRSTADNNTTNPDTGGAGWVSQSFGRLLKITAFSSNGTFTRDARTGLVRFKVQSGGGSGCGAGFASGGGMSLGTPGTAGGYVEALFTAAQVGASQPIIIGAGGASASGSAGANGGTSGVGTAGALISVPGGIAGNQLVNQTPPTAAGTGNASGTPVVSGGGQAILLLVGSATGVTIALSTTAGFGAPGGQSQFGAGGFGVTLNNPGANASNPGSGGGGCVVNASGGNINGGNGANGLTIVEEYSA